MKWILTVLILVAGASALSWTSVDLALATSSPFGGLLNAFISYTPSCAWDCGPTYGKIIDSLKIENGNLLFRQRTIEHTPGRITVMDDTVWVDAGSMQQ